MSGEELLLNVGNTYPHLFHKNKVMIQQIGRFIHEAVFVFVHRFNQAFGTFRRFPIGINNRVVFDNSSSPYRIQETDPCGSASQNTWIHTKTRLKHPPTDVATEEKVVAFD